MKFFIVLFFAYITAMPILFAQSSCSNFYELLLRRHPLPKEEIQNSAATLFESTNAMLKMFPITRKEQSALAQKIGKEIFINKNIPKTWITKSGKEIPVDGFLTLHATLKAALENQLGLSAESASEYAIRLQRAAIKDLGLSWIEYKQFLGKHGLIIDTNDARLSRALEELQNAVSVDRKHDILALAGYSEHSAKNIYLDRGLPKTMQMKSGKKIGPGYYLTIHEAVEKALLDEIQFTKRAYQRTHQIAQRIEKIALLFHGHSWKEYQYELMARETNRAYSKVPRFVPLNLDTIPYAEDKNALNAIHKAQQAAKEKSLLIELGKTTEVKDMMNISLIKPQIYHLHFKNSDRMAATMMRFQEFYESPKFRGKNFGRSEFRNWYKKKNGKFTYYSDWGDGFNIPSNTLKSFYEGKFPNLTKDEKKLLAFFSDQKGKPFYIIATAESTSAGTYSHEIAHALYYLNPTYKKEIDVLLAKYDLKPLKDFLYKKYGNYHKAVLHDEAHAWLMHNSNDLVDDGFDITPYKKLISELQETFKKYDK